MVGAPSLSTVNVSNASFVGAGAAAGTGAGSGATTGVDETTGAAAGAVASGCAGWLTQLRPNSNASSARAAGDSKPPPFLRSSLVFHHDPVERRVDGRRCADC